MIRVILILCALSLSGCASMLPQWRLFQKKVPAPIVKPAAQIETERRTADYIARKIEKPEQLVPMAIKLSESLGEPEHPITDDLDAAEARMAVEWHKALLKSQQQLAELNALLAKTEGKKIEGTGFNAFGMSFGLGTLILIILLVAFPPLGAILWTVFRRVSGALSATARGVSDFIKDNPEAGEKLKASLAKTQDAVHKQLISKIKAKL